MKPDPLDSLREAVAELKRRPTACVRARVDDLTVEVRAVDEPLSAESAAEAFDKIGSWEGETMDEIVEFLTEARASGGRRAVPGM